MALIVQKFGGTSVGSVERIRNVARRVAKWQAAGHELVVTSDKEGPDSEFDRHLADAEIVISQPFWPAYLTAERIAKAPGLAAERFLAELDRLMSARGTACA